jgi:1-acyl-sn-glycerol-3-phosphate acyltransferase
VNTRRPTFTYLVIGGLSYPVVRLLFRLRVSGRENLPTEGGYVLAANHWSNFDPWPLGIPLFPKRFLRFMAKSELFWFPLGPVLAAAGGFKVHRGQRDLEAIATGVELARSGEIVVMFPEGTRRSKGLRKKYEAKWHSGAARIAIEAGVPLVPAAVAGTNRLRKLGPLRVAYGEPLGFEDLAGREPVEAANEATDRLREAIAALEATLAP